MVNRYIPMPNRHEIVATILDHINLDLTVAQAEKIWFYDVRRTGGLRLTKLGFEILKQHHFQSWSVPIDFKTINKNNILAMNRRIIWPYYISSKPQALILFSDRDAVSAYLHGDVIKWVESLESKH